MAQLVIRNIEDDVKIRLQRRAKQNGRSMEEEVREILRNEVYGKSAAANGLGTEISNLFSGIGLENDLPELRGHTVEPLAFDK